jgi:heat shock protein HtpX
VSALFIRIHIDINGEATFQSWSQNTGEGVGSVVAQALNCRNITREDSRNSAEFRCTDALRHNGLTLEGNLDLAPIAQKLKPKDQVELWLDTPRLGFESSSTNMEEQPGRTRMVRTIRFQADSAPSPIHFQFGYRPIQLAAVYLPLASLALVLILISAFASSASLAGLARSLILLGTIVWMGTSALLQAGAPIRIYLYRTPFATLAALLLEFWPPLLCIAIGITVGRRGSQDPANRASFSQIFWGYAVIPLVLTCVVAALPSMMKNYWLNAAGWLVISPLFALLRRGFIRSSARTSVREITSGELRERVAALATKAGRPAFRLLISFSTSSQVAAAFALPGKNIFMTAALVRSLGKREVDAVAAHELAHFGHSSRGPLMALGIAMVLFETIVRDVVIQSAEALFVAMLLPLAIFFFSSRSARKREFGADASAAVLLGAAQPMIGSLAKISRINKSPLRMNAVAEWFASHPSIEKRIQALASAWSLPTAEVRAICENNDPVDSYELPLEEPGKTLFTSTLQTNIAGIYGWSVLILACIFGLSIPWMLLKSAGPGPIQFVAGVLLGCILTKAIAAFTMAGSYHRLERRLAAKLHVTGQIVGLAIDDQPRLYGGRRFSDAGILWFESGRLCYKSEQIVIDLNPADVVDLTMVRASPSNWLRLVPMIRFRNPTSGQVAAFILHPLSWLPGRSRLLKSLERWRATQTSSQSTTISGFNALPGQPFKPIPIAGMLRAFVISGGPTLLIAIVAVMIRGLPWWFLWYALIITASIHLFMFLPSMLYKPSFPAKTSAIA